MTRETKEAAFQRCLAELLERFDRTVADDTHGPYAGAGGGQPLEHTTRIHLLDALAELLDWRLGLGGDMVEEARIKNGTTAFMDYLGVARATNAPVLLIEAKAWDKPFITPCVFRSNPPPIPLSNWPPVMLPNRPPEMLSNRPALGFWPEAEATRRADTGQEEAVVATAAKRGHLVHEARGWRGSVQVTP